MPETVPDADQPIRDAATIVLVRQLPQGPAVLMGQRGRSAAFMPSKYVFPGGGLDAGDADVPHAAPLHPDCASRLKQLAPAGLAPALAAAAIRELHEETGLTLARPGNWPLPAPGDWEGFARDGLLPDASALTFMFRAITPPDRSRRFDARFFLADAARLSDDPDDLSRASGELARLAWVPLAEARHLDLPFITTIVLAEIAQLLSDGGRPASVPFFDNSGPAPVFRRLS